MGLEDLDYMRAEILEDLKQAESTPELRSPGEARQLARQCHYLEEHTQAGLVLAYPEGHPICAAIASTSLRARAAARRKYTQYLRHYPANVPVPMVPSEWDTDDLLKFRDEWLMEG